MSTIHPPISRRVLREEIKEHLIDAILRGRYRPGDRIVETRVAQELGVSQAPVREAIRDLELMGFVETVPFKGTAVRAISRAELGEVYPVRAALEAVAARLAAPNLTDEDIARLETYLRNMLAAAKAGDEHEHTANDVAFHQLIIERSGNKLLLRIWRLMQLSNWTFVTAVMSGYGLEVISERHRPLFEALKTRDPVRAADAMAQHIVEMGEWLVADNARHRDAHGQSKIAD